MGKKKNTSASCVTLLHQPRIAEGILRGSPIPTFVLDRNHKVVFWNEACERLTGFSQEEMVGTDRQWQPFYKEKRFVLADYVLEGDNESARKLHREGVLRMSPYVEGGLESERFFPQFGDGGAYLHISAAPIKDENGTTQGVVAVYQDITDCTTMARELGRRRAFLQNLVEHSIDGILATDEKGTIVLYNEGARRILGHDPEDVVGKHHYKQILSEENAAKIRSAFYSQDHGPVGKIMELEVDILDEKGDSVPVRVSGTLLYQEGREVGSVIFIQDLRTLLRLEREKERAERIATVGRVLAGMAHYIKNILSGLRGGGFIINTAIRKEDFKLLKRGWDMVSRNLVHMSNIVQDMLIYSTEKKVKFRSVNPNALVMDVLELMGDIAAVSNVSLEHDLKPGLPNVSMDPTAIHRCLLNLVGNAIDACTREEGDEKKGLVTVRTGEVERGGVKFSVEDNGVGMDVETRKRIFDDFFSTKGYKGTGLGLTVTKKIIEEHHGELTFSSEPGNGSIFNITLRNGTHIPDP